MIVVDTNVLVSTEECLAIAARGPVSAWDAEFVFVAERLGARLVTGDRQEISPEGHKVEDGFVAEYEHQYGKLPVLLVRMNPDLAMGDELLKKTLRAEIDEGAWATLYRTVRAVLAEAGEAPSRTARRKR